MTISLRLTEADLQRGLKWADWLWESWGDKPADAEIVLGEITTSCHRCKSDQPHRHYVRLAIATCMTCPPNDAYAKMVTRKTS